MNRGVVLGLSMLLGLSAALAGKQEGIDLYNRRQYAQAMDELRYAALGNDGDPEAQTLLGTMYLKGQGTEKDTSLATFWFQEAAKQGNATAERNLGGIGVA